MRSGANELDSLLDLASAGIQEIMQAQLRALEDWRRQRATGASA